MRETKLSKAPAAFELLAEVVSFDTCFEQLVKPLREALIQVCVYIFMHCICEYYDMRPN